MQKNTWAILGGGCLVVLLLLVGLFVGAGYMIRNALTEQTVRTEVETPVAVLRVELGRATVTTAGVTQELVPGEESEVLTGDEIVVSDDGRAAIVWDGHGRTLIDAGTRLRVTEAERPSSGILRARMLMDIGRTWTRLERLLGTDSEVSVGAYDVVATVRGTSFGLERQGNQTVVKVTESRVEVARAERPFSQAAFTAALDLFDSGEVVEAGYKLAADVQTSGTFDPPTELTEDELNDPFLRQGDRRLEPGEYDLSGWISGAERWLQRAIEYLAWRPWLLLRIRFGGETFREFYGNLPSDIRGGIESSIGPPDFVELERVLNW